ncbi:hypothetical protein [Methanomethylovorans sp.]
MKKYTNLLVSYDTRETIRAEAMARGMKMYCLVDRIVDEYVKNNGGND